jgi:hypothetical protein
LQGQLLARMAVATVRPCSAISSLSIAAASTSSSTIKAWVIEMGFLWAR